MDFSHLAFEFQWEQCFSLIDKWKLTMIDHINTIHQEKISQIQFYKDQKEKNFIYEKENFILNMNEYFQHDNILSNEINIFKNKLKQFKQNLIHRPLPLNIQIEPYSFENLIKINPVFTKDIFKQKIIIREYKIPIESIRLISTSNNQIILVNNKSEIYLYDKLIGFINKINLFDYTNEYLNDICWSNNYKNFFFLFDYSLWSLENLYLKKLAHITNKKHILNNLTSYHNFIFFIYNHGEFIDRWTIDLKWKLDKRWINNQKTNLIKSINSNNNFLLIYMNKSIQICTDDLIIQYNIDLIEQEQHIYKNFIYLSLYDIWLFIDKEKNLLKYFNLNNKIIQTFDQIFVKEISLMDNDLAWITKDNNYLQIISI